MEQVMKQRQSIHALLQTLLSILLLAPIITQAESNQPNLPNQPHPARQAPKLPEIDANGRLIIQPPSRPTPRTQKYPTDWQNYFQQHNAYKYKATLYIQGHGVADRTAGYTPFSERAYNEIESVLGRAPLWNTQTWSGAIREQQQKEGSIEIVGQLTTYGIQKKGDYNGYALFWAITNRDSSTTQQTAFDAIYPEIKKYNARANGINKQKLTPAQREKAWQDWEKQLYAAAPRKPTNEQRETWRKAVEYSQREAAIRANRSLPEQMMRDYGEHLDKTIDNTIDRAQDTWNNFANGAPKGYSPWGTAAYYANNAWNATKTISDGLYEAAGGNAAQSTAYDHYMPENGKQFIDKKLEQYQQWAVEHPEQNEFVKLAGNGIDALGAYKAAYPRHSPDFNLPHRDTTPPRIPSPDFTSNQHAPYNPAPYTPRTPDHQRQPNIPRTPDYQRQPNTPRTPDYQRHPNTPQKPDYNKPNTPHIPDHNKPTPNQIPFNPTKPDAPTPHKPDWQKPNAPTPRKTDWQKPDLPTPRQPDFRKPNAPAPRKPDIHKQPSIPTPHKPNVNKAPDHPEAGAGGNWDTINESNDPNVTRQESDTSCGAACAEMLLRDRDILVNQIELGLEAKSAQQLARDLNTASNSNDWRGNPVDWSSFDALNRTGSWAAMMWEQGKKIGHWVVVRGTDKNGNVIIHDPWKGTSYTMKREDFLSTWNGYAVYAQ